MGIRHAFAPDGRCTSRSKILLTNACVLDGACCINRATSNVRRASFTVEEVVGLTLDFYRRNPIEGLFLSSGIVRSPDYAMEQLVRVARDLRTVHGFRGYIHLKTIPDAAPGRAQALRNDNKPRVGVLRGQNLRMPEGPRLRVTVHPSSALRLPDAASRARERGRFLEDLRAAAAMAA